MARTRGLANSLLTPQEKVRKLQCTLYVKAKAEPAYRLYSLWDKIYRRDVLWTAYQRCRANAGSPGIDGETFAEIESQDLHLWLAQLQVELRDGTYRAQPLRREWIPKANGKLRPLGIPCIRDRVAQMAMTLVLTAVFEADLCRNQYGFRPRMDAKMAVRQVYFHVTQRSLTEIVDTDLQDYFNTIPHGPLLKSLARRISDKKVLEQIKRWLEVSVVERTDTGLQRTNRAKRSHRGTPQGGVVTPPTQRITRHFYRVRPPAEVGGLNYGNHHLRNDKSCLNKPDHLYEHSVYRTDFIVAQRDSCNPSI